MRTLLINIAELLVVENEPGAFVAGSHMQNVTSISNAWLVVENDLIYCYGTG
jgi:hypothetical protein